MNEEQIREAIAQYIENVLQRDPHAGEVDTWYAVIENNSQTLEDVQSSIINSSEAVNEVYPMILAYQAIYGRVPDKGGLHFWTGVYEANMGLDDPDTTTVNEAMVKVLRDFVNPAKTPEFVDRYGDDPTGDQFVAAAYQNVLNRVPDEGGLNYWQGKYAELEASYADSGMSQSDIDIAVRSRILEQFVNSKEYKESTADLVDQFLANAANETDGAYSGSLWELQDHTGQTFILTPDADLGAQAGQPFYGTDNDDTYIAGTVNTGIFSGNTLGTGDALNGAGGNDTLEITDAGSLTPLTPRTENIENVSIQALAGPLGGTAVDMINAQGVELIQNNRSTADLEVNNIQNEVDLSVVGSNSDFMANFAPGVDFLDENGDPIDMNISVSDAGIDSDRAEIFVSTNGEPTTLNIESTGTVGSFVRVDVDDSAAGPGDTVHFETLNITGDADLNLRDGYGGGDSEFDHVTMVNVNSTGGVDLDFSDNDEDVTYNGADGSGNDHLDFSGTGDNTINTGAGDDWVVLNEEATTEDTADGGAGNDTLEIDTDILTGLTANGDFAEGISNFEALYAEEQVDSGETVTIDLRNLDNINFVTTEGTEGGESEVQHINTMIGTNANGGLIRVGGVDIALAGNLSADQVANEIAAHEAEIIAANPNVTDVESFGSNYVHVTYSDMAGDVPPIEVVDLLETGVDIATASEDTPGVPSHDEQQTITITTAATSSGTATVTFAASVGGQVVNVPVVGNELTTTTATNIAAAINAEAIAGVTAAVGGTFGDVVTITYAASYGNVTAAVFANGGSGIVAGVADNVGGPGATGTPEVQTAVINAGATTDGAVLVGGVAVPVTAGMTADEVGFAIVSAQADILAANSNLANINYDTASHTLTFTYLASAGDILAVIPIVDGNDANDVTGSVFEEDQGEAPGTTEIIYATSGGTLELDGSNDGITHVTIADNGANDVFNLHLLDFQGPDTHDGIVDVTGIETVNLVNQDDDPVAFGLAADGVTTLNVSGEGGVDFGSAGFADLTTLNASGVTGTDADGAVKVTTNADADTSLTGGAGDDVLTGSDQADNSDTINGGIGNDVLSGRAGADNLSGGDGVDDLIGGAGADTLTGGANADNFVFQSHADSTGATVDTITDFVSGEDKIDLSAVLTESGLTGAVTYLGEATSLAAANTALTGGGTDLEAIFDTSAGQLYVDFDGSGDVNAGDMIITLTGVTTLQQDDFGHIF